MTSFGLCWGSTESEGSICFSPMLSPVCTSVLEDLPIAFPMISLLSFPCHVATYLLYLVYFCLTYANGSSGIEKTPL